MSKKKQHERLRAPLMYAFRSAAEAGDSQKKVDIRDDSGERVIAARRVQAGVQRSLSDAALKALLSEDLVSLLNTIDLESADPELIDGLDRVRKSIVNFGLPDLSNRTIDESRVTGIRFEIEETLRRYEPRLLARTLNVSHDLTDRHELKVRFLVRSDMRADPVPTAVEFVTEVEFDTGEIKIGHM